MSVSSSKEVCFASGGNKSVEHNMWKSDYGEDTANFSMICLERSQDKQPTCDEINEKSDLRRFPNTIILEISESASEHSSKCNKIASPESQNVATSPNILPKVIPYSAPLYKEKKQGAKSSNSKQRQFLGKKGKVKTSELDSTTLRVLNEIYGSQWQNGSAVKKNAVTEPNSYRNVLNSPSNTNTSCSSSGSSSTDFEHYLDERRARFGAPDFNNDSIDENSLGFYQGLLNDEIKTEAKKVHKILGTGSNNTSSSINRKLSFSSSRDDVAATPMAKSKKTTKESKKQKVIVSPARCNLKTPKTEKPNRGLRANQKSTPRSPVLSFLASLSDAASKEQCHPEALYYKQDFKNRKEELCRKLFSIYNSEVFDNNLPEDLLIQWSTRMNKSAGFCFNRRCSKIPGESGDRVSRLAFSTKVCDSAERLRDTLIHELCHAACWLVDEVKDGHGQKWKAWASKARSVFPELPNINRCHNYAIFTKYTYRCTRCGYCIGRHSKSLDVTKTFCGKCHGTFEVLVNRRRKSGTVAQKTVKKRSPGEFARFVKENYSTAKVARPNIKHAEVMRLLGNSFQWLKQNVHNITLFYKKS